MTFPFKLRCLNGPLAGRDIMLPVGLLQLSGADPDILFSINAAGEIGLVVEEKSISLKGDCPLWIAGAFCTNKGQALPLETVIDLSGQAFVLACADAVLGDFQIPIRQKPRLRISPYKWFFIIIGLLLLGGLAKAVDVAETSTSPAVPLVPNTTSWLGVQSQQLGLPDLSFSYGPQQEIVVSGYCEQTEKLKTIYTLLANSGLTYRNQIICHDTLLRSVRSTLENYGYLDVVASLDLKKGSLQLDGAIVSGPQWEQTYAALLNLRGIAEVKVSNQEREMFNELLVILKQNIGLEGLSVVKEGHSFLVSGALEADRREKVQTVIERFNQTATRLKAYFQNIPPAVTATSILPSAIMSYGGSENNPTIQLASGLRLYQGSVLPNNYVLEAFYPSGISARQDTKLIFIPNAF